MAASPKPSALWNVPFGRNRFFTGRDDVLHLLHQELQIQDAVALSQPQAITGLGGIGKTQMALEYAYRYGSKYAAVLWVRAASSLDLVSSFMELARVLNLPERDEQDQNIIVEAVLRWLHRHTGWLLIFDNMDDLSVAKPFLPNAGSGHLLFTTRAQAVSDIAQCVEVSQMSVEIGALLLLRRAEIIPLQAPLNQANEDNRAVASEISREVDGLPLALDQAGAYISATSCSLRDYLLLYRARRQTMLQERGSLNQDYPASVATTWSLSFGKVSQANAAAAELLHFCAFLAPDAIPEEIMTEGASYLGPVLGPVVADPVQFNSACQEVLRFSLFQREGDARTLTIHRLVQAVLKDTLERKTQDDWMRRVIQAIHNAFPDVDFQKWTKCERLLAHVLICMAWIKAEPIPPSATIFLLNRAGTYLIERGRYSDAEPLLVQSLANGEKQMGPDHIGTAMGLGTLAELYQYQGKYEQAEPLYLRSLAIREKEFGEMDQKAVNILDNLGILYWQQEKYDLAEPLFKRALSIYEQTLGENHRETSMSLNNLAMLYTDQEKYDLAEPLFERALAICEQQLGADHPDTANGLYNLAELYYRQGKQEQAVPLYKRSLAIWEQYSGETHPQASYPIRALAEYAQDQGKYEEAEALYQRALAIRQRHLGPVHPLTQGVRKDYAAFLRLLGRAEEADLLETPDEIPAN
jgi:tetratricopeptide (TPR) repeat protein